MKLLENVQRRWIKIIDGFENLTYSQRLKYSDLFSVEGRFLRADVIKCWVSPQVIIVLAWSGITRGHRFKIVNEYFSLDCKRRSFVLSVASTWNSLPDNVVARETLGSFKRTISCHLNEKLLHFV